MAMAGTRWLRVTGVTGAHSPQCNEKTHLPVAQMGKNLRNLRKEERIPYSPQYDWVTAAFGAQDFQMKNFIFLLHFGKISTFE